MKKLAEYLICIVFGVVIGFVPYYIGTKEALNRPTVTNQFKKVKTKNGETSIDVNTVVEEEEKSRRWRLFNRNK